MITKAQSKRYAPQPSLDKKPKLSAMERGMLRWSTAERGDKVLDVHVGTGLMLEYLNRNMECELETIRDMVHDNTISNEDVIDYIDEVIDIIR